MAYVKRNFLNGLELSDFEIVNPAARHWLETVANVRVEKLSSLPPLAYEAAVVESIPVNSQVPFQGREVANDFYFGYCLKLSERNCFPRSLRQRRVAVSILSIFIYLIERGK